MDGLSAGLRNELQLMFYRKKTMVFFAVTLLIPLLLAALFRALHPVLGLAAISSSYPVQMLEIYTLFLIPLFMLLEIADLFPQEISSRTLKLALLRPITRFGAYMAKFLALGISIGVLLLLLGTVSALCNLGLGMADTGGLPFFNLIKAYFAAFLSMGALAALFVCVAQFFRSAAGFLVFSILIYAGVKAAPYFVKGFSYFSIASYTDWYVLWLSHSASAARLATGFVFLLSGMVLFLAVGFLLFDRREV
ncbi:ABC transporter permease [Paenibacillus sp. HN-1]|uniref:ABC transporter permease n=1 Tax=Paenibacillus TaxID=44249 RepID=UPI001CA8A1F5|nr:MULTISPECIES: ABC transporter permease [Paenibacillus]MBY9078183.1 ABC transporter permease [Paenibacillus sp. CGMCC 1.18879]MBY9086158.1 ABC transporter permease [Paenibacillus sinensis]